MMKVMDVFLNPFLSAVNKTKGVCETKGGRVVLGGREWWCLIC